MADVDVESLVAESKRLTATDRKFPPVSDVLIRQLVFDTLVNGKSGSINKILAGLPNTAEGRIGGLAEGAPFFPIMTRFLLYNSARLKIDTHAILAVDTLKETNKVALVPLMLVLLDKNKHIHFALQRRIRASRKKSSEMDKALFVAAEDFAASLGSFSEKNFVPLNQAEQEVNISGKYNPFSIKGFVDERESLLDEEFSILSLQASFGPRGTAHSAFFTLESVLSFTSEDQLYSLYSIAMANIIGKAAHMVLWQKFVELVDNEILKRFDHGTGVPYTYFKEMTEELVNLSKSKRNKSQIS